VGAFFAFIHIGKNGDILSDSRSGAARGFNPLFFLAATCLFSPVQFSYKKTEALGAMINFSY